MNRPTSVEILDFTESLCPYCLQVIEAQVVSINGAIYMKKTCPNHGPMTVYLWNDREHYQWMHNFRLPFTPPKIIKNTSHGCPLDCGLCSMHLRHPTLVEIEVTQKCNLKCPVCFMAAGEAIPDPSLETIEGMYAAILQQTGATTSIQLTGGEPTIRSDLPEIIRIGCAHGFSAIEVNTNGIRIGQDIQYASRLVESGASGIYLQFDGLTQEVYQRIRGTNLLDLKLRAIEHCQLAGIQVVLAMTVIWGINHDQIGAVLDFALQHNPHIAGVAYQVAFSSGRFALSSQRRLSMGDVISLLAEQSHGLIQTTDLLPLGCSHPLCSCATYLIKEHDKIYPFTRGITPQEYARDFNPYSPQGSVFADMLVKRGWQGENGLSVVVMNYMDAQTIDLKRLKECSMMVTMEDGRLIPFCIYQLTSSSGKRYYPAWGRETAVELTSGNV